MQLWNSQNTPKNASESVSYLPEICFRPGGFAPLVPLAGLCPGPTGGHGGPQAPCLLCFHIVQGLATPLAMIHVRPSASMFTTYTTYTYWWCIIYTFSTVAREGFNLSVIILTSLLVFPKLGCRHSFVALQFFTFLESRMHIFKQFYFKV